MTGVEDWNQYRAGKRVTGSGPTVGSTFSENPRARQVFTGKAFTRRKRMTADERRDQIVKAAVKVIAVKGFWGMSLQDVADQVGITEAALYHYINSKNDLFSMVMEQAYDSPVDAVHVGHGWPAIPLAGGRVSRPGGRVARLLRRALPPGEVAWVHGPQ